MSTGSERRRDLGGVHGMQPGVLIDRTTVPIVLLTDGDHMFSAEDLASACGFETVEDRRASDWRNGPEAFMLTEDEWTSRIIIVGQPLFVLDQDEQYWQSYVTRLQQLTGREVEIARGGDLIVR